MTGSNQSQSARIKNRGEMKAKNRVEPAPNDRSAKPQRNNVKLHVHEEGEPNVQSARGRNPRAVNPNNTLKPIAGRPRIKSPEETNPKNRVKSLPKYMPMQPKVINAKLHGRRNVKLEETEVNQCQMTGANQRQSSRPRTPRTDGQLHGQSKA